jgi:hypothetical protein
MVIQQEMESWSKFRRGLRKEDQETLDELFRAARLQLAGSAYAARPIPFESIAMSMLLAQQRRIKDLERLTGRLAQELVREELPRGPQNTESHGIKEYAE